MCGPVGATILKGEQWEGPLAGQMMNPLLSFRVAQAVFADEHRKAVEEC